MAHEKPIVVRDENFYLQLQSSDNTHEVKNMLPKVVGRPCHINMLAGKGMPKHITNAESAVLFGVIKANTTFVLSEPVQACKSVAVTLIDRQLLHMTTKDMCVLFCGLCPHSTINQDVIM